MRFWQPIAAAPRKQRHTAHRIWQRIVTEQPERKVSEVTIRQYVRERKRELGWSAPRDLCAAGLRTGTGRPRLIGMKHGRSSKVNA